MAPGQRFDVVALGELVIDLVPERAPTAGWPSPPSRAARQAMSQSASPGSAAAPRC